MERPHPNHLLVAFHVAIAHEYSLESERQDAWFPEYVLVFKRASQMKKEIAIRDRLHFLRTPSSGSVGSPNVDLISTSYAERLNATTRLHMRRLTRLTLAFSKKRENFTAAVGLHFAHYNFVKRHNTLRCTPAMAGRMNLVSCCLLGSATPRLARHTKYSYKHSVVTGVTLVTAK